MRLNERENLILKILIADELSISEILLLLNEKNYQITRITLNRDLASLEKQHLVRRIGQGKATKYKLAEQYKLWREINFAEYFSVHADDRKVQTKFDFDIYTKLLDLFLETEKQSLEELNNKYRSNIERSSRTILRKELERLVIELSWKSSKLEGNTYTLLDTERLIKDSIESTGHQHEEAVMILNHKQALDYVISNQDAYRIIDSGKILRIHSLLTKDLDISEGFRTQKVGIIGTQYKPLTEQIDMAIDQLCETINREPYPLGKALIALAMISYIQAFQDGNKRTARILSTAILLAHNYCPISYRKVDDYDYKKALLLFYEQNNLYFLKRLFMEQFEFSVNEYW